MKPAARISGSAADDKCSIVLSSSSSSPPHQVTLTATAAPRTTRDADTELHRTDHQQGASWWVFVKSTVQQYNTTLVNCLRVVVSVAIIAAAVVDQLLEDIAQRQIKTAGENHCDIILPRYVDIAPAKRDTAYVAHSNVVWMRIWQYKYTSVSQSFSNMQLFKASSSIAVMKCSTYKSVVFVKTLQSAKKFCETSHSIDRQYVNYWKCGTSFARKSLTLSLEHWPVSTLCVPTPILYAQAAFDSDTRECCFISSRKHTNCCRYKIDTTRSILRRLLRDVTCDKIWNLNLFLTECNRLLSFSL